MSTSMPTPASARPNRDLLILFSVVVLDLIGFGVVVPILPFYAKEFGANATVMGLLLMSYSAMQFLFSMVWGRISDKIGRKPVLLLTMAGSCGSLILLGLANSLLFLFIGRILSGIFAANIGIASAYVTDVTAEKDRAKGMGLIGAAFGIGFLLGPALGGILSRHSYHLPILTAAALTGSNLIYAFFRLKEPEKHKKVAEKIETKVLSNPKILRFCATYFLFTLSVNQLEAIFAFFMMDRFGYDAMHVAGILAMMALIMILVQGFLIRSLTVRFGEKLLTLVGAALLVVSFAAVPFSPTVALLLIPLSGASLGRGLSQPALMSLVSKESTSSLRGSIMGTFQASASLARVFGPLLAGFLYDRAKAFPFYFAAALMFGVLALVPKRWKKDHESAVSYESLERPI
jgi:DHA1 family tetracycline resistance protein-like MFS transporter